MTGPDEELVEVVIPDDAQPPPAAAGTNDKPDELAELRNVVEESRRRTEEASRQQAETERERDAVTSRLRSEIAGRVQAQETALDSSISAIDAELANHKRDYAAAAEAGEWSKLAEINDKIAEAKINRKVFESQKTRLTDWKADQIRRAEAAAAAAPAAEANNDPLAAFSEPTRVWLKAHPEVQPGQRLWNRAQAYHNLAVDEGIKPDTPEYFNYIEEKLGMKQEQQQAAAPARKEPPASSSATPPSRSGGTSSRSGGTKVRLTAAQAAAADRMSILGKTPEERRAAYAQNLVKAVKAGEIPESELHWA